MSKTDTLRAQPGMKVVMQGWRNATGMDFAFIDGDLYAVVRAHIGIGVDKKTRKVIYKESETLVRLIMPDPWPDA